MALLLSKYGKQILRLSSSSSAAVTAKSQQQLGVGGVASKYLYTTSIPATRSSCFGVNTFRFTTEFKPKQQDNVPPPNTLKSFFYNLFSSAPPPPTRTPFQELLGKFMDLVEQSQRCPEDRLPRILDDIRPVLNEVLYRMTNESVTRLVYEFARPAASSPPVVIDRKVKAMVDQLPSHVIHLFIDMLIDMIEATYIGGSYSVGFDPNSRTFVYSADVSHIGKEHLKLFVVKNYLMVTGTDKAAPPAASPQLLALSATIHNILSMPSCPYSRDEVTASILEDHEQGSSQLKIVVPKTEVSVNNPRVFQLNLDTKGAHQG